jgi:hypothetical protein
MYAIQYISATIWVISYNPYTNSKKWSPIFSDENIEAEKS